MSSDWLVSEGVRRLCRRVVLSATAVVVLALATTAPATFPGANGRIAYSTGAPVTIHTVLPSGHGDRTLAVGTDPSWSANGQRIAFNVSPGDGLQADIFTMLADGSDVRQLTHVGENETDFQPAYSPSGGRIVFRQDDFYGVGPSKIISVRSTDGSDPRVLATGWVASPEYSPDGKTIVYEGGKPYGIWAMRPDGSHHRLLTRVSRRLTLLHPDYSPDGSHIIFMVRCEKSSGCRTRNVVMRSDGSHRHSLPCNGVFAVYSPDGNRLASMDHFGNSGNIFVGSGDDCQRTQVTFGDGFIGDWQPLPGG